MWFLEIKSDIWSFMDNFSYADVMMVKTVLFIKNYQRGGSSQDVIPNCTHFHKKTNHNENKVTFQTPNFLTMSGNIFNLANSP